MKEWLYTGEGPMFVPEEEEGRIGVEERQVGYLGVDRGGALPADDVHILGLYHRLKEVNPRARDLMDHFLHFSIERARRRDDKKEEGGT